MALPPPLDLRNSLVGLIIEALGDGQSAPAAREATAVLLAYTRLARPHELAVSVPDLLDSPTPALPAGLPAPCARGLDRLCPDLLVQMNDRVALRPAYQPHFPAVRERAVAYAQVLKAAAALGDRPSAPLLRALAQGVMLFNAGLFFEAHEALENVWRDAQGDTKVFLQGMAQIAAALHHHTNGNDSGARTLLSKGCQKLRATAAVVPALDVHGFLAELEPWGACLGGDAAGRKPTAGMPVLPRLRMPPEVS